MMVQHLDVLLFALPDYQVFTTQQVLNTAAHTLELSTVLKKHEAL